MEFTANSVLFMLTGMILYYEIFAVDGRIMNGLFCDLLCCWTALAGIRAIVVRAKVDTEMNGTQNLRGTELKGTTCYA